MTATFTEPVTGFGLAGLTLSGATVSNFAGNGGLTQFTFDVTPSGDGVVSVDVGSGVAVDAGGNANSAAVQYALTSDRTAPTVSISSGCCANGATTNESPLDMTVTFSEAVSGFVVGDLTLAGGSVSNFVSVAGDKVWTFDLTPSGDGTVSVDISAGVASDAGGTGNSVASQYSVTSDRTAPTVALTAGCCSSGAVTNLSPVGMTATFSESVSGFTVGDVVVVGGSASNFVEVTAGTVFTFDVAPTGDHTVTIDVGSNSALDVGGTGNTAAPQFSYVSDRTAPTVVLSAGCCSSGLTTNASPLDMTVTFSEPVSGFVSGDVGVVGGTLSSFSAIAGDEQWTFDVTPSGDGTVSVEIAGNVAVDAGGTGNVAASTFSVTSDRTAPTGVINAGCCTPGQVTNVSPLDMTVTFSEAVYGFWAGAVTVSGGSVNNFVEVSSSEYTFDVTPLADGSVTVDVAAGSVTDGGGTDNTAASQFTVTSDRTAPTVSITSACCASGVVTNVSPLSMTVEFSESVSGFVEGDVSVVGGTVSSFSGNVDNDRWTFDLTPSADGAVSVNVAGGVAVDAGGTGNAAATQFAVTSDQTAPTVSVTAACCSSGDVTNVSPLSMTVSFSESVEGFAQGDLTVTGGLVSSFSGNVQQDEWTFDLTPSGDGLVTVDIGGGKAVDAGGTGNVAAPSFSVTSDRTAPTVSLSAACCANASTTNIVPVSVTATFSEAVSGFVVGDVAVGGGSAGNFVSLGNDMGWTFDVTPSGDGVVTVDVAAGRAVDAGGTGNVAADRFLFESDTVAPTVSFAASCCARGSFSSASSIALTATFSEAVSGFGVGDVVASNANIQSVVNSGDSVAWVVTVQPVTDGNVTVHVNASRVLDAGGTGNEASAVWWLVADQSAPSLSMSAGCCGESLPTNEDSYDLTATFSDSVLHFRPDNVTVNGGSMSSFVAVPGGVDYTFTVTPSGDGVVSVDITTETHVNVTGFPGPFVVTGHWSVISDRTVPTVTLTSDCCASGDVTYVDSLAMTATFSEGVSGFAVGDLSVSGGSVSAFSGSDGDSVYTFTLAPAGDGAVSVDVASDVAVDVAANGNDAATQFAVTSDRTAPSVAITAGCCSSGDTTNVSPLGMTVTFSEAVSGFVEGDLSVSGGTVSNFAAVAGDEVWTFDLTPAGDGTVTVDVASGAAADAGGTVNTAASQFSVLSDRTPATVSVFSSCCASGSVTNVSPLQMTAQFSESVAGMAVGDLNVTGGSVSGFVSNPANDEFTFAVTPSGDGMVRVHVPGGSCLDAGGSANVQSNVWVVESDRTAPTVSITAGCCSSGDTTNVSPLEMTVAFSESVSGFWLGDLTVSGGTVSNFAGNVAEDEWTFDLTPTGSGLVVVGVGASVAVDSGGTGNLAATDLSVVSDQGAPTVVLSSACCLSGGTTNEVPIAVDVSFSEPVFGFDAGDIVVVGGSIDSFNETTTALEWVISIVPDNDGVISIDVGSGSAEDSGGTGNLPASQFSVVSDTTPPTVGLLTACCVSGDNSNQPSLPFTAQFSEPVFGFVSTDLILSGGFAQNFTAVPGGTLYLFEVIAVGDSSLSVEVPNGVAQDIGGNINLGSSTFELEIDVTAPIATITMDCCPPSFPSNANPAPVLVSFSEAVVDFHLSDIAVSNGIVSNFVAISAAAFSFSVAPSADGEVEISIPAGVCHDGSGNANEGASPYSFISDLTAPTVLLSSSCCAPFSYHNDSSMDFTATFSENVTGFWIGGLRVINGVADNFVEVVVNRVYVFDVVPISDGVVSVDIMPSIVSDLADNFNLAAPQYSVFSDQTPPGIFLVSSCCANWTYSNLDVIDVSIVASETLFDFSSTDIFVSNGILGNFSNVTSALWHFEVYPINDGIVSVNIPGNVAVDIAGNANPSILPLVIRSDRTSPTANISSDCCIDGETTNAFPMLLYIRFSEPVSDFLFVDLVVSGASINLFTPIIPGLLWSFQLSAIGDGLVSIELPVEAVIDKGGNRNLVTENFTFISDRTVPTVSLYGLSFFSGERRNFSVIAYSVEFSEYVNGLDVSDLFITNGMVMSFNETIPLQSWLLVLSPITDGIVSVEVPGGSAVDAGGNGNLPSTTVELYSDRTVPNVTISAACCANGGAMHVAPLQFHIQFSEPVFGFSLDDIVVANGLKGVLLSDNNDRGWSVSVNPLGDGLVQMFLPARSVVDAGLNFNNASNVFGIVYDTVPPSANIFANCCESGSITHRTVIPIFVEFSEAIFNLSVSDFIVANGTVENLVDIHSSVLWGLDVRASVDGPVSVYLPAGVVHDSALAGNLASDIFSVTVDRSSPEVSIEASCCEEGFLTKETMYDLNVTFSEPVIDFSAADVNVTNGALVNFTNAVGIDRGFKYFLSVQPTADGLVIVEVAPNTTVNVTGKPGPYAVRGNWSVISDVTAPEAFISANCCINGSVTNLSAFDALISFSEDISDFEASDLIVKGANISGFSSYSENSWTFQLESNGDGVISVEFAADIVTDTAGNLNVRSYFQVVSDRTAPTVEIGAPCCTGGSITNRSSIPFTVLFSEKVTGFSTSDLQVVGGTVGSYNNVQDGVLWEVGIIPSLDGIVQISLPANEVRDLGGTGNIASSTFALFSDRTPPLVSVSAPCCSPTSTTNAAVISMEILFSESVSGFAESDMVITGATVHSFTNSLNDIKWTFDLIVLADGLVSVSVPAGRSIDGGGNGNLASGLWYVTSDRTPPTGVFDSPCCAEGSTTNRSTIAASLTFSEPVNGLDIFDLTAVGLSVQNLTEVTSRRVWEMNLIPDSDGVVSVAVSSGLVVDDGGNGNEAVAPFTLVSDRLPPTVSLFAACCDSGSATNLNPIMITASFSESIEGLNPSAFDVTGANITDITASVDNSTFEIELVPLNDGLVVVSLPVGSFEDEGGNLNIDAVSFNVTSDQTAPLVEISSPTVSYNGFTNRSAVVINITSSEQVDSLQSEDLVLSGPIVFDRIIVAEPGRIFLLYVNATGSGLATVSVKFNALEDVGGSGSLVPSRFRFFADFSPPSVVLTSPCCNHGYSNLISISVDIEFSEPVLMFDQSDLIVSNGIVTSFTPVHQSRWSAIVQPGSQGVFSVFVDSHSFSDRAGNLNVNSSEFSAIFDTLRPSLFLDYAESGQSVHSADLIEVKLNFSEPVVLSADLFDDPHYDLVGVRNISSTDFIAIIRPGDPVNISLVVEAAAVHDLAGNQVYRTTSWFNFECPSGFAGRYCASNIDDCFPGACSGNGQCNDGVNSYTCTCDFGFTGLICNRTDYCTSSPCHNGGTCSSTDVTHNCTCMPGFVGYNCTENVNDCGSSPCLNGGMCIDGITSYLCDCAPGFVGQNCSVDLNPVSPSPNPPVAAIYAPTAVGFCAPLVLDGSISYNFNDEDVVDAMRYYEWTMVDPHWISGIGTSGYPGSFVRGPDDHSVLQFNASELVSGTFYTFALTVMNYANVSSVAASIQVYVQSDPLPLLYIHPPRKIYRSSRTVLTGELEQLECAGASKLYVFSWSLVYHPAGQPSTVASMGLNGARRDLEIPAYVLKVGGTYKFRLVAKPSGAPLGSDEGSVFAETQFTVIPSDLVPFIVGSDRFVTEDASVLIDGSFAFDPDAYDPESASYNITFATEWFCQTNVSAVPNFDPIGCGFNSSSFSTMNRKLSVAPYFFTPGVYKITMCLDCHGSRMQYASLILNVSAAPPYPNPSVLLLTEMSTVNSQNVLRIATSTSVDGQSIDLDILRFTWTELNHGLDLLNTSIALSGNADVNLVIAPGVLSEGQFYLFQCQVIDTRAPNVQSSLQTLGVDGHRQSKALANTGGIGLGRVLIEVNSPPYGGSCELVPNVGESFATDFSVQCENWRDKDHYPLLYEFGYRVSASSLDDVTLVTERISAPRAVFQLPPGNLTVVARIYDALGARSELALPVKVVLPNAATDNLEEYIQNVTLTVLLDSVNSGDLLTTVTIVEGLGDILNSGSGDDGNIRNDLIDVLASSVNSSVFTDNAVSGILGSLNTLTEDSSNLDDDAVDIAQDLVGTAIDQFSDRSGDSADSGGVSDEAADVLSNLLEATGCSRFDDIQLLLQLVVAASQQYGGTSDSSVLSSDNFGSVSTTHSNSSSASSSLNSTEFVLPPGLLDSSLSGSLSDTYDVHVITFGEQFRQCRLINGTAPSSDLTVTFVTDKDGNIVNVTNLDIPISFYLPVDFDPNNASSIASGDSLCPDGSVAEVVFDPEDPGAICRWWDTNEQTWTTEGCETLGLVETSPGSWAVHCACTHLTEFAILLDEAELKCNGSSVSLLGDLLFLIWLLIYLFVAVLAVIQIWRILRYCSRRSLVQHGLVLTIALFRSLIMAIYYSWYQTVSLTFLSVISSVPLLCTMWLFSILIFSWASMVLRANSASRPNMANPLSKFRLPVFLLNIAVSGTMGYFMYVIGSSSDQDQKTLSAQLGSYLIAGVSFLLSLFLFRFGLRLVGQLRVGKEKSATAVRLFRVSAAFSVGFLLQSACHFFSITWDDAFLDNFRMINSIYYSADVLCMIMVLVLFYDTVVRIRRLHEKEAAYGAAYSTKGTRSTSVRNAWDSDNKSSSIASNVHLAMLSHVPAASMERPTEGTVAFQNPLLAAGGIATGNLDYKGAHVPDRIAEVDATDGSSMSEEDDSIVPGTVVAHYGDDIDSMDDSTDGLSELPLTDRSTSVSVRGSALGINSARSLRSISLLHAGMGLSPSAAGDGDDAPASSMYLSPHQVPVGTRSRSLSGQRILDVKVPRIDGLSEIHNGPEQDGSGSIGHHFTRRTPLVASVAPELSGMNALEDIESDDEKSDFNVNTGMSIFEDVAEPSDVSVTSADLLDFSSTDDDAAVDYDSGSFD